jgi:hypothetical protein
VEGAEFNVTVSMDGRHWLQLKAVDAAGNEFVNVSAWSWVLDTAAPTSCFATFRPPCTSRGTVNTTMCVMDVVSGEGLVRALFKEDSSSDWTSSNSTVVVAVVGSDGSHTVSLKVCPIVSFFSDSWIYECVLGS